MLIGADKFQSGGEVPLLEAMDGDKPLGGLQSVQTLSRLNRGAPGKKRVFLLDFQDKADKVIGRNQPDKETYLVETSNRQNPRKLLAGRTALASLPDDPER